MASSEDAIMQNIRDYAQSHQAPSNAPNASPSETSAYEQKLDQTIQELQERVTRQRAALESIRAQSAGTSIGRPSADKREKIRQLQCIKSAYESLTPAEPSLPSPDSLLPAVLALRTLQRTITGSKEAIATTQRELAAAQAQLRREQAEVEEGKVIGKALDERIAELRGKVGERQGRDANELANEMVGQRQARKLELEGETVRLHEALGAFVSGRLAPLVAAEELGGPVVGDELDIGDEELASGAFDGRKKRKAAEMADGGARQRRIDEIWGHAAGPGDEPASEREAAAQEMQALIEDLIRALVEGGAHGEYVQLSRDSAASRFLVRAKVAQFHPKDARKLRLIDFGRELDGQS